MADPLSVAASIVGIISLGLQVSESLLKYYDAYRDRDKTVQRISNKLEVLTNSLKLLDSTIQHRQFHPDEASIKIAIESSLNQCEEYILVLQKKCDKIQSSTTDTLKGSIVLAGSRIVYPLKKSTLEKLDENIRAAQECLVLALNVLQLRDGQQLQSDTADVKRLVETIRASQISTEIRDWLNAPDVATNHNSNCAKRHPGSGSWFIQSSQFISWLEQPNSFLWIAGFAGSGKSVLCSTAIQHAFRRRDTNSEVAIACFYFTFTDQDKQDASSMLRTLILQLSGQAGNATLGLSNLYDKHKLAIPSNTVLLDCLHHIIQKLQHVYILLDALDEIPRGRPRKAVLDIVKEMRKWSCAGLHLLATSRNEVDIRDRLPAGRQTIILEEGSGVDQDIKNFVESQLKTDTDLLKWKKHHDRILTTLTAKAHGVWIECQLEAIKQCPRSSGQLVECLNSLPEDLDETYERILCNIKGQSAQDAKRILTALSFSVRPLTVSELIDVIAVDTTESPHLNRDFRYEDPDSLLEICPGLIQIYTPKFIDDLDSGTLGVVRIAHFSVQEYLESPRIKHQKAHYFSLDRSTGNAELAEICLLHLLEPQLAKSGLEEGDLDDLPLVDYAAEHWPVHYHRTEDSTDTIRGATTKLFNPCQEFFQNWVRIHDHDRSKRRQLKLESTEIGSPLYYASCVGVHHIVGGLLNTDIGMIVQQGFRGSPLHIAANRNHKQIVQLLLDRGADVNAQGYLGTALCEASMEGHEQVVQLLLDSGADVNAQGVRGTALYSASWRDHGHIVQLLLDRGADINAMAPFGTALSVTSEQGHEQIVRLLIERGANVNIKGSYLGPALCAASTGGHKQIVQLLLDSGADIDAQGCFGTALCNASMRGHEQTVQLLLDSGADINAPGHRGSALCAASEQGHKQIVQLLLDRGADILAHGGHFGSALYAASSYGYEQVVQLLLDRAADVNIQGGQYGTPLCVASTWDRKQVVQLLLDSGADVNAQGGIYTTALCAASAGGHKEIVQLLLARGANIDTQGDYGTALLAASWEGREEIVRLLLDQGADFNAQSNLGTALTAASSEGHKQVVQMLLDSGARVNIRVCRIGTTVRSAGNCRYEKVVQVLLDMDADSDGQGEGVGTALSAASVRGHEQVVRLLLDSGADVNARVWKFGTALCTASSYGYKKVVQLLLDNGADVNAQGDLGTALSTASLRGDEQVVQLLLDSGADVNARTARSNETPLQLATRGNHRQTADMLLQHGATQENEAEDAQDPGGRLSLSDLYEGDIYIVA